ncbi:hypothetical protein [Natrialbaceae archaeon AArc-T1-2]|uniref:hypothetical protein n=1 Tax=Natrialbaceae archaeon AArc-T1-2 TaxID=3053904 RepID=UPI00255AFEFD|nr:hypothetical protein [Natrialbaceae archaeon AArc-T1-2]WIV67005.1 hypothetical protein QQ977_15160 [Natrialbaceae archaeon AArc-T1-2]
MSQSNNPEMHVGCPRCNATVNATVPPGPGIDGSRTDEEDRLRGTETACDHCGHELELYYY